MKDPSHLPFIQKQGLPPRLGKLPVRNTTPESARSWSGQWILRYKIIFSHTICPMTVNMNLINWNPVSRGSSHVSPRSTYPHLSNGMWPEFYWLMAPILLEAIFYRQRHHTSIQAFYTFGHFHHGRSYDLHQLLSWRTPEYTTLCFLNLFKRNFYQTLRLFVS